MRALNALTLTAIIAIGALTAAVTAIRWEMAVRLAVKVAVSARH
jgi:hypothetical protein